MRINVKKGVDIKIYKHLQSNGSYIIKFTNIGLNPKTMQRCGIIIKNFVKGEELFFGHYRTDGVNLTGEEWGQYEKEIPEYFQENGKYEPLSLIVKKKHKVNNLTGILTAGSLPINDKIYEILPKIFHYYLETVVFCPKIDWETFVKSYREYMKHGTKDYVLNGYTDFLFAYTDSGDFSISFDPNRNDPKVVYEKIYKIIWRLP